MNSRKHGLIISSPLDLHARAVAWGLQQYGADVTYFDTSSALSSPQALYTAQSDGCAYSLSNKPPFDTVWDRRRFPKNTNDRVSASDRKFVRNELMVFERNLLQLLERTPDIRWVDPYENQRAAENKLAQLNVALSSGLMIPRTLVGSDPNAVRQFIKANGKVVVKPFISHLWVENDRPRYEAATALISSDDTLADASITVCPAIYQEAIDKAADIRVVLIGERVFATRYAVGTSGHDHIDVRVNIRQGNVANVVTIDLPTTVVEGFHAMARDLGITYASADFLEDKAGNLWFIDLNPAGQFLFNESYLEELPLLDALVRHLLDISPSANNETIHWKDYLETADYNSYFIELAAASGNAIQPEPFWTAIGTASPSIEAVA